MPKLNDRDRLADLEARQLKIAQDILDARRALRGRYAAVSYTHLTLPTIA